MKFNRLILTVLIILLTSVPVSAATVNWNISGDGLWSESAKWIPVKVPDFGDDVFINNADTGTITVSTNAAIKTLTVGGAKNISLSTGKLTLGTGDYTSADLVGTWYMHQVTSGDSPDWLGWAYAAQSINSSGVMTWSSYLNSAGETSTSGSQTLSVSSGGIVSVAGYSSFHGVMSQDKSTIVATMDDGGHGYDLAVMQKSGGTFTSADLVGTWYMHQVTSGDSPQWTGWAYAAQSINSSGVMTWSSYLNSAGETSTSGSQTLSVSSGGIVSVAGYSSFHGVMSQDKSTIVATMDDGGHGYDLAVMQKSGGTFTSADLVGTWNFHCVTSGDSPNWLGWSHGAWSINSSGVMTWLSMTRSDGDSSTPGSETFSISSSGIVTCAGKPSFHGVMSLDKKTIVATMTEGGGGGYDLMIYQK